jgi:hypothetical protein
MAKSDLTADFVRQTFDYDPTTGLLVRKTSSGGQRAGAVVSCRDKHGYITVMIRGRNYMAHRLAWLHVYGTWPSRGLDHINGNRADNRICNLRDVCQSVNMQNQRKARSNNKCGLLGVCRNRDRWRATIKDGPRVRHLGTFDTPEQAHESYLIAKRALHIGGTL